MSVRAGTVGTFVTDWSICTFEILDGSFSKSNDLTFPSAALDIEREEAAA
jgi:hypothetical protein